MSAVVWLSAVPPVFGGEAAGSQTPPSDAFTFTRDVAPIVFAHCSSCHQPGGSAPFSLLTSADLKTRARLITTVVRNRVMPPWKAEPGHGQFVGERRLTDEQIDVIVRWLERGAREGSADQLPPPPPPANRWQLGEPDLVVTMAESFALDAGGNDVFRNFVLPVSIPAKRYVRAWEFRPGNARIVHHATMHLDPTRSARQLDEQDPGPGYTGLVPFSVKDPEGYFLGWTPGQRPFVAEPENAWSLEKDTDLVVMMHMRASGKPEDIQASIGLYFSDSVPLHVPATLRLSRQDIDIPSGAPNYRTADSYTLPVDVNVHSVYPHAHYLAKEVRASAKLPDGSVRPLLLIRDWDFNWQDVYRYAEPIFLPAGSTLTMEFTYDNSAQNPRNPHQPPRRVTFGQHASNEMGDLWVQVVPRDPKDLAVLTRDFARKSRPETIRGLEMILRVEPDNRALHDNVALLYQEAGDPDRALAHFAESLRIVPDSATAHYNLGTILLAHGRSSESIEHFQKAVEIEPGYVIAHNNLAVALQQNGRSAEAEKHYLELVRLQPDDATGRYNLGAMLQLRGKVADGIIHLREALRLRPRYAAASYTLGVALSSVGHHQEAVQLFRDAIAAAPDWPVPLIKLAWILATSPDPQTRRPGEALILIQRATTIIGKPSAAVFDVQAASLAALGEFERAVAIAEIALASAIREGSEDVVAEIQQRLNLYRSGRPYLAER